MSLLSKLQSCSFQDVLHELAYDISLYFSGMTIFLPHKTPLMYDSSLNTPIQEIYSFPHFFRFTISSLNCSSYASLSVSDCKNDIGMALNINF